MESESEWVWVLISVLVCRSLQHVFPATILNDPRRQWSRDQQGTLGSANSSGASSLNGWCAGLYSQCFHRFHCMHTQRPALVRASWLARHGKVWCSLHSYDKSFLWSHLLRLSCVKWTGSDKHLNNFKWLRYAETQFSDVFRRDRGHCNCPLIITCLGARSQHVSSFPAVCFASIAGSGMPNRAGYGWEILFLGGPNRSWNSVGALL